MLHYATHPSLCHPYCLGMSLTKRLIRPPRSAWNLTRFLRVEVCVVVDALAKLVVVEKKNLQVLFEGEAGAKHGPSRIPSDYQQRLSRILNKGESKY